MNKYVEGVDRYTFAKFTPYDEKVPGNQSSSMCMSYVLHKLIQYSVGLKKKSSESITSTSDLK